MAAWSGIGANNESALAPWWLVYRILSAAGTGALLTLIATPEADSDPGLTDAMFAAILGFILTDAPGLPESNTASAAVALRAAVTRPPRAVPPERALLAEWLDRLSP